MNEIANRNIFICGAGFSRDAGAPLLKDFLDRSREFHDDPNSKMEEFEREHFRNVFDFRRNMSSAREKITVDLDNIEHLFGLVEIALRLDRVKPHLRTSMVYVIAKTLELAINPCTQRRPYAEFEVDERWTDRHSVFHPRSDRRLTYSADLYDLFAAILLGVFDEPAQREHRQDCVITFNYDLVVEQAIRRFGAPVDYCLGRAAVHDGTPPVTDGVKVLKLHGSANWGVCPDCTDSIYVLPDKVTTPSLHFHSMTCGKCGGSLQPLLIPPSWNKAAYTELMQPVWQVAIEQLMAANRICIIGYSMPESDAFFKYLLSVALAENHNLYRMHVVDKTDDIPIVGEEHKKTELTVEDRYRQWLEPVFLSRRFKFFGTGLAGYLNEFAALKRELGRAELLRSFTGMYQRNPNAPA